MLLSIRTDRLIFTGWLKRTSTASETLGGNTAALGSWSLPLLPFVFYPCLIRVHTLCVENK